MEGVSFSATTDKRKGIRLDPRTKLILLLTVTTLMFSTSNEGIMNFVKPVLSLIPFVLILSDGMGTGGNAASGGGATCPDVREPQPPAGKRHSSRQKKQKI